MDIGYKGGNIVEIGTHLGLSAAFLAQYAPKVYTFDVMFDQLEEKFKESVKKYNLEEIWKYLNVENKIERRFVSLGEVADVSDLNFSFAFIDGDHKYESVKKDFNAVKHCGAVMFHDYNNKCGVNKFVDSIDIGKVIKKPPLALWIK